MDLHWKSINNIVYFLTNYYTRLVFQLFRIIVFMVVILWVIVFQKFMIELEAYINGSRQAKNNFNAPVEGAEPDTGIYSRYLYGIV